MMELLLERIKSDPNTTIGNLWIDSKLRAFTLEDEYRTKKVMGETRIQAGRYELKLRNEGGMAPRYNARFAHINHRGMIWLQDVPNFTYVYIHVGNDEKDTEGCILVGFGADLAAMRLTYSVPAYEFMYKSVASAIEGEGAWITIIDRDLTHG